MALFAMKETLTPWQALRPESLTCSARSPDAEDKEP